jgi:hypothetical protein
LIHRPLIIRRIRSASRPYQSIQMSIRGNKESKWICFLYTLIRLFRRFLFICCDVDGCCC